MSIYIEGSMSSVLALEAGVPQGSILGPIYYTIYTYELSSVKSVEVPAVLQMTVHKL